MSYRLHRIASIVLFVLLGVLLLSDGTSNALLARDPSHPKRVVACYTALELALGVNAPSILRPIEVVVGLTLLCYSPWARRRRKGEAASLVRT